MPPAPTKGRDYDFRGRSLMRRYLSIDIGRYLRILSNVRRKPDSLLPIELAILLAGLAMKLRGNAEFYGYAVAKEMREHTEARRLTAHGTLYRALERLEQRSMLQSHMEDPDIASAETRPRRRLYTVTALGATTAQAAERTAQAASLFATKPGTATS